MPFQQTCLYKNKLAECRDKYVLTALNWLTVQLQCTWIGQCRKAVNNSCIPYLKMQNNFPLLSVVIYYMEEFSAIWQRLCINLEILLAKLHFCGIRGISEGCCRPYFTNRWQKFEVKSPKTAQIYGDLFVLDLEPTLCWLHYIYLIFVVHCWHMCVFLTCSISSWFSVLHGSMECMRNK